MPQKIVFEGVTHEFPDDFTPAEIQAALSAPVPKGPSALDRAADLLPTAGGMIGGLMGKSTGTGTVLAGVGGAAGEGYRQLVKHATELPGAVADVTRNLFDPNARAATIKGAGEGMVQGAKTAGTQAAIQGASELAGRGLVKGVSVLGKGAMGLAVNPKQLLKREFADIPETLLRERIPVGKIPGTASAIGSEQAAAARGAARKSTDALYQAADTAGLTTPHGDVLAPVVDLTKKLKTTTDVLGAQPGVKSQTRQVNTLIREYLKKRGTQATLKPTELQAIKKEAASLGEDVMAVAKKKDIPAAMIPSDKAGEGQFNFELAKGARNAIRNLGGAVTTPTPRTGLGWLMEKEIPGTRGLSLPGASRLRPAASTTETFGKAIDAGEKRVQDLIGATRGLKDAEARTRYLNPFEGRMVGLGGLSLFGGIGAAAGYTSSETTPGGKLADALKAIIATRLVMDPRFLSRVGLAATHRVPQALLSQIPRAAASAIEP